MSIASEVEKLIMHVNWEPVLAKLAIVTRAVARILSPEHRETLFWVIAVTALLVAFCLFALWRWGHFIPKWQHLREARSTRRSNDSSSVGIERTSNFWNKAKSKFAQLPLLKMLSPWQLVFVTATIFVAYLLVQPIVEASLEQGNAVSPNYAEGARQPSLTANQGDATDWFNIGLMYEKADGVAQDYTEAAKWYRLSADQGNARAQSNLGNLYYDGNGVPEDYAEALKLYRLAAYQGYAGAQFNLGTMYDIGKYVRQDYAEALKWYLKAADQGYVGAQFNLGAMYSNGEGVPRDAILAYMWFDIAANGSGTSDTKRHYKYVEFRDKTAEQMTKQQIAEAQRLTQEWLMTHLKQ